MKMDARVPEGSGEEGRKDDICDHGYKASKNYPTSRAERKILRQVSGGGGINGDICYHDLKKSKKYPTS